MRVLVGFDGSEGARDALALARVFCSDGQGRALLVNVMPNRGPQRAYWLLGYEHSEQVDGLFDDARKLLSDPEVETRVYKAGSPAFVLSNLAEEEQVDLLVVGSPHRGAIGRALIGSVAEDLLHGARVPTVVAPRGYAHADDPAFKVVAVAYDGRPESKLALAYAQDLAAQSKTKIRILNVEEPMAVMPGVVGYTPPPPTDPNELIEEALATLGKPPHAEGRRLIGATATSLAEACEDGVDILIAGSRGHGPAGRVLLGSVSTQLIHKAPCPVLVVPRGTASEVAVAQPRAAASAARGG